MSVSSNLPWLPSLSPNRENPLLVRFSGIWISPGTSPNCLERLDAFRFALESIWRNIRVTSGHTGGRQAAIMIMADSKTHHMPRLTETPVEHVVSQVHWTLGIRS